MSASTATKPLSIGRIAFACTIGATIEWYDFFLYGSLASLVFNKLFFPAKDPAAATIMAYGAFAVGYLGRLLGGLLFGHFGDRIGRRRVLVITLFLMGLSTVGIGILPTYETWGVMASLLLVVLRMVQGMSVGGEWGGAALMAIEHAPPNLKGYYGSWPQIGVPVGLALGAGVVAFLNFLPEKSFLSWGWRVAYLVSVLLVAIGIYIRMRILETPEFEQFRKKEKVAAVPLFEVLQKEPLHVLLGMGARYIEGLCFVTYGVFFIAYMTKYLNMPTSMALTGVVIACMIQAPLLIVFGWLSDKMSRRKLYIAAALTQAVLVFPAFWWLEAFKGSYWCWLALIVPFGIAYPALYGPWPTLVSDLFSTRVRYTGICLVYQGSGIFAVGIAPIIYITLLGWGGNTPWYCCAYYVLVGIITALSVTAMRRPGTLAHAVLHAGPDTGV
jgi:MFS family permease